MGKKGKRSRRKAITAADRASIYDLQTQLGELNENFKKSDRLNFFSQAADELREVIQLFEATILESNDTLLRMNLHAWFIERKVISYANLLMVDFDRHKFSSAIQIYENLFERCNIKINKKILSFIFPTLQLRYHEALLRQGRGSIDTFISLSKSLITHGRKDDNALERDLRRSADILRTRKHFDVAIALGKQLKELTGDTVSIATTYLEQYLVEYYPKFGRNIDSLPESFDDMFKNMGTAFRSMFRKYYNGGFDTSVDPGPLLVLTQWTYLFHQYSSDGPEVMMGKAIGFIEEYLDSFWNMKNHCSTCGQTGTPTEVQLVCSGCRVACYCSIDHQRMTWKKEAESGMRFGHEVLCPVMKAYRKWRDANDNGDNERVSRLRRRFERECLYCLSDGMGLKDKCFQK